MPSGLDGNPDPIRTPAGPAAMWHLATWCARLDRYVTSQRLYAAKCNPRAQAGIVVDNNDLSCPVINPQVE